MKTRIKKGLFSVLLLLGTFLITGCHGSTGLPEFVVPDEFDTAKEYEITFWAKNDTNKNQTAIYKKAIEDFQTLYPNITVNMRLYTDYSRIYNDVITNIATNTTPNVCITYPDHIATYLTGNQTVAPLNALFADEQYGFGGDALKYDAPSAEEIVPKFLDECSIDGSYYAIPFMRSTEVCYVNQTLVEALGYELPDVLTWDFIWEVSDAATARKSNGTYLVNGQNVMIPFIYKSTDNMMIQMLKQKEAGYSTSEGIIELFNDTTTDLLHTIAGHVENGAFSTFKISSYPANFLNAGQCIFAIDSTAGATWMGNNAPLSDISANALVEFETAVRMVPQFNPDNPQMISQGPSICVFNKNDSQEVLASWLFAQYLLTNEVQIAYSETEGYIPVTASAQNSAEYQDYLSRSGEDNDIYYEVKIEASRLLLEHMNDTFVTPVFNGSASLRDAAGQLIENVTKSVRRKETINDAYMKKLYDDVTALYRLDQTSETSSGKNDLGELPLMSTILLITLAIVWGCIIAYVISNAVKHKLYAERKLKEKRH